jgi:hypothetical protein
LALTLSLAHAQAAGGDAPTSSQHPPSAQQTGGGAGRALNTKRGAWTPPFAKLQNDKPLPLDDVKTNIDQ